MTLLTLTASQKVASDHKVLPVLQVVLASCFIAICAQIKIPLYFTPIPLTVQTSAIMLIGAMLGSRKATLAVLCYLIQGWIGLPVWAGGASGLLHFMGPTGGYLIAYLFQACFIGKMLERRGSFGKVIAVLGASICIQLGMGSLWLAHFVGIQDCFSLGFTPFLASEVSRAFLLAIYIQRD